MAVLSPTENGLDATLDLLLHADAAPLPWTPDPRSLQARDVRRAAAVDGSHGVLVQNGALWVVAVRAAAVQRPGLTPEVPTTIHATLPDEAAERVAAGAQRLGLPAPPRPRTALAFAEAVRAQDEVSAALDAVGRLHRGDLLMIDGALRDLPGPDQAAADLVADTATDRGVLVAGVTKRSTLSDGGVPLVPRVSHAIQSMGTPAPWAVPVPDHPNVWIARLHRASPDAFRVDGEPAALDALVPWCRDAVYTGYPYPLAAAHNAVVLTAARLALERARVEAAVRRRGGRGAMDWVRDFHTVLDRNVRG